MTPIYEAVCRDLRYRPRATRISVNLKANTEQFTKSMQAMQIAAGNITWYFPNVKLEEFNPA